jgi:hypothetical protein
MLKAVEAVERLAGVQLRGHLALVLHALFGAARVMGPCHLEMAQLSRLVVLAVGSTLSLVLLLLTIVPVRGGGDALWFCKLYRQQERCVTRVTQWHLVRAPGGHNDVLSAGWRCCKCSWNKLEVGVLSGALRGSWFYYAQML